MTVEELVKDYSQLQNEDLKKKYLTSNVKITTYVPYTTKVAVARNISEATMYDDRHELRFDTPASYLFYSLSIIDLWTNIDIDFIGKDMAITDQYDLMDSNGLIEEINSMIPEKELDEFKIIFDMIIGDIRDNETSLKYIAERFIVKLGKDVGDFISPILDQISKEEIEENQVINTDMQ